MNLQNTLENISKHSNKLIKILSYYNNFESDLVVNNLSMIDSTTDIESILIAFNKDLKETASLIFNSLKVLSTTNEEGIISELKNDEKDINKLFPKIYNDLDKTITLFGHPFDIYNNISKKEIENLLCIKKIEYSYEEFRSIYKKISSGNIIFNSKNLSNEEEKISYLSNLNTIDLSKKLTNKIIEISENHLDFRKKLSNKEKSFIDTKIISSRAMIDSITQQSTYINNEKIIQISNKHKEEKNKINKIIELMKDSIVEDIEIDPETDLDKIINVFSQLNKLKFNLKDKITFKIRKLGNYKANGLYLPSYNIVAVDLSSPSSLIHEMVHAVDINNDLIFNSEKRDDILDLAYSLLDNEEIKEKRLDKFSYFFDNKEVIARLGEISFILNEYNYQSGDVKSFFEKVKLIQKDSKINQNDILIVKNIDNYYENEDVYFNFSKWDEKTALDIKEFYNSYFSLNNNIKQLDNLKMFYDRRNIKKTKIRSEIINKRANIYNIFTNFNSKNIENSILYNKEYNIIDENFFINSVIFNPAFLSRKNLYVGRKGNEDVENAFNTFDQIYDISKKMDSKFNSNLFLASNIIMSKSRNKIKKSNTFFSLKKDDKINQFEKDVLSYNRYIIHKVLSLRNPDFFANRISDNLNKITINDDLNKFLEEKLKNDIISIPYMDIQFNSYNNSMVHEYKDHSFDKNSLLYSNLLINLSNNEHISKNVHKIIIKNGLVNDIIKNDLSLIEKSFEKLNIDINLEIKEINKIISPEKENKKRKHLDKKNQLNLF